MDRKKFFRRTLKGVGLAVAFPVVLFLLLAIALYIPPIQNFLVHQTAARISASTGLKVSIDRVRLAFPLDLAVHGVQALDKGDTLFSVRSMRLDVSLLPLFQGRADINGFSLYGAVVDTRSYVSDVRVRGRLKEFSAASHGVEWRTGHVQVDRVLLSGADLSVALSDTARKDTSSAASVWVIDVKKADIRNSAVRLSMPGDSMRVFARLGAASLRDGLFDTGKPAYSLRSLHLASGQVVYESGIHPDRSIHEAPALPLQAEAVTDGNALPPFDPNHISVSDLGVQIDTLSYDSAGTLRMGIRRVALRERCGLTVNAISGSVYMDSARLSLPAFRLRTAHSRVDADIDVAWRALSEGQGGSCVLRLDGEVGHEDVLALARGFVPADVLAAYPRKPLALKADVQGNVDHLAIRSLDCSLPGIVSLQGSGHVREALSDQRSGAVKFDLRTGNLAFVRALMSASVRSTVGLPSGMRADGTASFARNAYKADARVAVGGGVMTARAFLDTRREAYDVKVTSRHFPLADFLPGMGLGRFTGSLQAAGSGFDVMKPAARLRAEAVAEAFHYGAYDLGGIRLEASLHHGEADVRFKADTELLEGSGTLVARLGKLIDVQLDADLSMVDLRRLASLKDTLQLGAQVSIHAQADRKFTAYGAEGGISNLRFLTSTKSIPAKDIDFSFHTAPDLSDAAIRAGDLELKLLSNDPIDKISGHADRFFSLLSSQLENRRLDQNALKAMLPTLRFYLNAGADNPLAGVMRMKGYTFSSAYVNLNTAPDSGIDGELRVGAFRTGGLLLDTVCTTLLQDTTGVKLKADIRNFTKKNPHKFQANLDAYLLETGAGVELAYFDADGEKGVDLGVRAEVQDSGVNICLYPEHPVIAYRGFTVNKDNYIFLGNDRLVSADVDLLADDGTGLKIYGQPKDSANDLTLSVNRVNLSELSTVLPYLPQLGGSLSGDLHVTDKDNILSAMASIQAADFSYEGTPLGDVGLEAVYLPASEGEHHASAFVSYGGEEVMECEGIYYERDGGFFEGEARLHDFPLLLLNGFMTGTDMAFRGNVGGDFSISGTTDKPVMEGQIQFDSAHVYSDVYGFDFRLDQRPVRITRSRMAFEDFGLYSTGENAFVVNGTLDMADFSRIGLDFNMRADNYELINTNRKKQSLVYGKVYANYQGTLRGTLDNIFVRGKLEVLDRTDMTYILKDSPLSVDDRLHDLVQFVSFEDSVEVEEQTVSAGGFDMTLGLSVSDAARFHCDLSEDGQSYVDIEGGGDLTLRMTQQGDLRLTGRFTAGSGEMKYALPVIPLKTFKLVEGSYVDFTGDVMNPTLNIAAKERVKATVTENDQPRSVAFDVGVAITRPLENMGLEFTIEAPEDLSVQNELAAMSQEQRSKAAVTMLATGMYLTDESKMASGGFKANNALNAFLQSEIQNIAGNALRTIDINLGVESGTSAEGTNTTDYSFQFAKRFWGNRVSVIVGGKVSTGADAENSAASFIDNVSVEYRLDKSSTRYVKVFYDRDIQDPLEGQLTKTGAGLVLRRKTNRLGELFIFRSPKPKTDR